MRTFGIGFLQQYSLWYDFRFNFPSHFVEVVLIPSSDS